MSVQVFLQLRALVVLPWNRKPVGVESENLVLYFGVGVKEIPSSRIDVVKAQNWRNCVLSFLV